MIETVTPRQAAVATVVRVLVVVETVAFLLAALLHLGERVPVGFAVLATDRILPAAIVEGLAGIVFAVSAYAVFTRTAWAWPAAIVAHAFALAGVLLGMWAIAAGFGPHSVLNDTYHRVMLVVLAAGLALLSTPSARAVLGRGKSSSQRETV
jgi:hypothetical protein